MSKAVFILSQLNLDTSLLSASALGKNIKYKSCAVDYLYIENIFYIFCLIGGKLTVKDCKVYIHSPDIFSNFLQPSGTYTGGAVI